MDATPPSHRSQILRPNNLILVAGVFLFAGVVWGMERSKRVPAACKDFFHTITLDMVVFWTAWIFLSLLAISVSSAVSSMESVPYLRT